MLFLIGTLLDNQCGDNCYVQELLSIGSDLQFSDLVKVAVKPGRMKDGEKCITFVVDETGVSLPMILFLTISELGLSMTMEDVVTDMLKSDRTCAIRKLNLSDTLLVPAEDTCGDDRSRFWAAVNGDCVMRPSFEIIDRFLISVGMQQGLLLSVDLHNNG